jgi:TrmH family RNA methyltransferase
MRVGHVSSKDNELIVRMRRLSRQPGAYRKAGEVLLEGEHLCAAWAASTRPPARHALVAESAWSDAAASGPLQAIAKQAVKVTVVADRLLADAGTLETPASIAFLVDHDAAPVLDPQAPTVVLDRLQDAGNVGSILRSAAAFGFLQAIALEGTASLWSPKVLRAGQGAHVGLTLHEHATLDDVARLAVPLQATSSHAERALGDGPLAWPLAWAFGNEGEGVAPALAQRAVATWRIPQPGGQESLNVAAAAAICLYASRVSP